MSKRTDLQHEGLGELFLAFTRCDFSAGPELDEKGRLTRTFRTLELGAKEQSGRRLIVTRKMLEQMANNFEWRKSRGYKTPAVVGHPGVGEPDPAKAWEKRIASPAVGWAQSVEVREDGLYVTVTFNPSFSKQLDDGSYEFNSPSFAENWTDEFGKDRGAVLIDVGILNYPLQEGLGSIMAASALAGGHAMDPKLKKMLDDILARLAACEEKLAGGTEGDEEMGSKLAEMGNRLEAVENAMKGEGDDEGEAKLSAAKQKLESYSKLHDQAVELADKVESLSTRLDEVTGKAHDAECLSFLNEQIDSGKLAPGELPEKWEETPGKSFDTLGFKSLAAARKRYAAIPANSVVDLSSQQAREAATDHDTTLDALWNASSMREKLIERFDGDETKARKHFESLSAYMARNED